MQTSSWDPRMLYTGAWLHRPLLSRGHLSDVERLCRGGASLLRPVQRSQHHPLFTELLIEWLSLLCCQKALGVHRQEGNLGWISLRPGWHRDCVGVFLVECLARWLLIRCEVQWYFVPGEQPTCRVVIQKPEPWMQISFHHQLPKHAIGMISGLPGFPFLGWVSKMVLKCSSFSNKTVNVSIGPWDQAAFQSCGMVTGHGWPVVLLQ